MNEDRKKRGLTHSKLLMAVAIGTLFLNSGNVLATQVASDSPLEVTEQLQTQTINGLVVDANGEPVIGASIIEKGTTNGGITDINGKFTLTVKPGATLKISYIGYQTQEVKAARTMKIILKEDSELLQEVVVVGYGTQKKANLTGAVAGFFKVEDGKPEFAVTFVDACTTTDNLLEFGHRLDVLVQYYQFAGFSIHTSGHQF